MRYRLRTLLMVLALGPPVLAGAFWGWQEWRMSQRLECRPAFRALGAYPVGDLVIPLQSVPQPIPASNGPGTVENGDY